MSEYVHTQRFVKIMDDPEYPNDGETVWWMDTARSYPDNTVYPYILVQTRADKDPNVQVRYYTHLLLLFTDQAECFAVCSSCYAKHSNQQWTGSTSSPGWTQRSRAYLERHRREKGWCEFCDPVFGNGGWR